MTALTCQEVRDLADAFALHTVEPPVEAAIREHLAVHPDGHPEYEQFAQIVPALAYLADPVQPPLRLRARIMAAVAGEQMALGGASATASGIVSPAQNRREAPLPATGWRAAVTTRRVAIAGWATAAASIGAAVAIFFSGVRISSPQSETDLSRRLQRAVQLAEIPGSRVALIGAPGANVASGEEATGPTGMAVIPRTGPGVLMVQGLTATTGNQVYEAWAIVGTAAPVPVGSFTVGGDRLGALDSLTVPPGETVVVALTLEPAPGATKPTLPIVASGKAG